MFFLIVDVKKKEKGTFYRLNWVRALRQIMRTRTGLIRKGALILLPILGLCFAGKLAAERPEILPVGYEYFYPLGISPDGRFVAAISAYIGRSAIYDRQEKKFAIMREQRDIRFINAFRVGRKLAFIDNSRMLSTISNFTESRSPMEVAIWNLETGAIIRRFGPVEGDELALSPDGKVLATVADDSHIALWQVQSGEMQKVHPVLRNRVSNVLISLRFVEGGNRLLACYIGDDDNHVAVFDVKAGRMLWETRPPGPMSKFMPCSMALSPDERTWAVGSYNGRIAFLDAKSGKCLHVTTRLASTTPKANATQYVAFSPDGRLLVSGGNNGVALWDVKTRKPKKMIEGQGQPVFLPDGKGLVYGTKFPRHEWERGVVVQKSLWR